MLKKSYRVCKRYIIPFRISDKLYLWENNPFRISLEFEIFPERIKGNLYWFYHTEPLNLLFSINLTMSKVIYNPFQRNDKLSLLENNPFRNGSELKYFKKE